SPEIHELVAQSGIPYLHIATHSNSDKKAHNLPISQFDNIFQVCASDTNYGSGVSRFLQTYQHYYPNLLQNRIILVIRVKWQPIDIGIDKLIFDLKKEHWRVEVLDLDKKEQDFENAMKAIHQIFPSMVVLASYFAEDMVNFHHAFTQQPTNAVLYSIYAPSAFLPENQPCEGVIWSTTSGLSQNYLGQQFCQHYEQFFGYQPSYSQASIAFDQVNILANVWKQSFSTRAFKTISEGIRAMPHYGVNGTYYFGTGTQTGLTYPDNTKDLSISLPHLVYQIQQGYSRIIAPEMFANTFFKLPPWFSVK
ncbi:MAG: ABC transporter substrate-binding protein, partial [Haemophilus paraphrohaemolyticus]|nr:ABC transporter substrate-binding protein [Haemophilus paraphrohaemolyticus]